MKYLDEFSRKFLKQMPGGPYNTYLKQISKTVTVKQNIGQKRFKYCKFKHLDINTNN